jgi:hypothetical protein
MIPFIKNLVCKFYQKKRDNIYVHFVHEEEPIKKEYWREKMIKLQEYCECHKIRLKYRKPYISLEEEN